LEAALTRAAGPFEASARVPEWTALEAFQHVPIEIEAQLDRKTMTLRDVLGLDTGAVLTLGRSAGENIDLLVGGALVAFGEIVVFEEVMGVRITAFKTEK
jgi:flagellar motor switch protein FliN/FliY